MNKIILILLSIALSLGVYQNLKLLPFLPMENGNNYAAFMFRLYAGKSDPAQAPAFWHGRKLSCQLSSCWFNLWSPKTQVGLCNVMASYFATLFLTICLAMIWQLKGAVVAILGTFSSVMCCHPLDLMPYLLPWDLLTALAYTVCFLAYRNHHWPVLLLCLFVGGVIKETVLTASLLLLAAPWRPWRQWTAIIGVFLAVEITSRIYCGAAQEWTYAFKAPDFSRAYAIPWILLANAGAMTLLPFSLVKLKNWVVALTLGSFCVLQFANDAVNGLFAENRVWLDIAPVSWLLIGEAYFPTWLVSHEVGKKSIAHGNQNMAKRKHSLASPLTCTKGPFNHSESNSVRPNDIGVLHHE